MKKISLSVLMLLAVISCSKFDDSSIWEELKEHESRILKLETLCNQMNTNITSLKTIVAALQENDYVKNIAPITENGEEIGYTITFAKNGSITIYHGTDGKDGKDGVNGTDGSNGEDGIAPVVGIKQDLDGVYYWTLNGEWLLDDAGNKIPTTGKDGQDGLDGEDGEDGQDGTNGSDGKDGITPKLRINEGYWQVSYDNGNTWTTLGQATNVNGVNSIITSVSQDDENVYFNLNDGQILSLEKRNGDIIIFKDMYVEAICVKNWDTDKDGYLSYDEAANVDTLGNIFSDFDLSIIHSDTSVKFNPITSFEELKYFTGLKEISSVAFMNCKVLLLVMR